MYANLFFSTFIRIKSINVTTKQIQLVGFTLGISLSQNLQPHQHKILFWFSKIFRNRFSINIMFNTIADFVQNIIIFSNNSTSSIKKIHSLSFSIITFYICAHFWKNYTDIGTLSISIFFEKN